MIDLAVTTPTDIERYEAIAVRAARPGDAALMASLHGKSFASAWSDADFVGFLARDTCHAAIAGIRGHDPAGFALWRTIVDETELLTIAVDPRARRRGLASRLLTELIRRSGATRIFLEAGADNEAARMLYERFGFVRFSHRPGYYGDDPAGSRDAVLMRRLPCQDPVANNGQK